MLPLHKIVQCIRVISLLLLISLKWLTPHRRCQPATLLGLPATVKQNTDNPSASSAEGAPICDKCFGDVIPVKRENVLRVGFQNIGGYPVKGNSFKEDNIQQGLTKWDFDIFGMAEINVDWRLVPEEARLPYRSKEWWEHQHVSWAHNCTGTTRTPKQFGGTALFSVNQAAHRVTSKGKDSTGLGRWTWTRYKGKGDQYLRVISSYRPNPPNGPFTVYAQQNAYFNSLGQGICPRIAFLRDLRDMISEFMEQGDQIVLLIDGNSDMRSSDLQIALQEVNLREVILERHGLNGPETYKRNTVRTPIDGIWATPGIQIQAGGYFKYDEVVFNTDHRCLWVDISFMTAFGHNMMPLFRPKARRLNCKDPRLIQNYIHLYHKYAAQVNLFSRVRTLNEGFRHMSKFQVQQEYETLDALRCKATAFAESKCRKLRMGQVAFSPQLNHARLCIKAWLLLLKQKEGVKVSSRLISRSLQKAGFPSSHRGLNAERLKHLLKEAYKEYYHLKGQAKELRSSALEDLAEAIALQGNRDKDKVIKDLRTRERQRASARKIRYIRGKLRTGSTTMVTVVDENGDRRDITDRQQIERAILRNNKAKFSQSFHTPFYTPPLRNTFGFRGLSMASQMVLAGVYDTNQQLDPIIQDILQEWKKPEAVRALGPINMTLTVDQYKAFWNKAKENVACYPAELSFSTMKAGSFDDDIAELECAMTKIPLEIGFAPSRWKKCLDVMIMKKSGATELTGLRTIVLFPVDCNYAFKHVGREMMKVAEQAKVLAPEQFGSRRGHRAIDLAVNKALTFDVLRQLRRSGGICSNDAKSCYDLIGHTQASICMQRMGTPKEFVDCLFTTLQDAIHKVRTGYGDSNESYGGTVWLVPLHGIGQGNGAGPAIWAVVSTPLLNLLRSRGFGCEIVSPLSSRYYKFVGYAFVDDTDIIQSSLSDSSQDALAKLQLAIDTWENGLKATCGAVVPEKTVWWLVSFRWSGGYWRYASIDDCPGDLFVNDLSNARKKITRLEPHQAYETLGVFLAPDGNHTAQVTKLKKCVAEWADAMRTGKISKDDVWIALQTTIWRTLAYPLPALRLTKAQCDTIMAPLLRYGLPAMGVCRNFSRQLVFSSKGRMGLGFKHIYTMQEISRIKDIITSTHANTLMGSLYRTSLELLLIEVGRGADLNTIPKQQVEWLATDSLVKSSVLFLITSNIFLQHDISIPCPREEDAFLMVAVSALDLSYTELQAFNNCRLFLKVQFVSDITTGDGIAITEEAWQGKDLENKRGDTWPRYERPPRSSWIIWQSCLRRSILGRGRKLRTPLGRWLISDESWTWFFYDNSLYSQQHNTWCYHHPILRRQHLPTFALHGTPCAKPNSPSKATVYKRRNQIICTGYAPIVLPRKTPATTFTQYLAEKDDAVAWCLQHLDYSEEGIGIATAIREGTAIAVSDGSYKDTYGTAAWIIAGETDDEQMSGRVISPGSAEDQSSYRSELTGLYAILLMANLICEFYDIKEGSIEVGCDGLGALTKSFWSSSSINRDESNQDLLAAIRSQWHTSPLLWTFRHVKGHQDENKQAELDRWARLNIQMDRQAKDHIEYARRQPRHFCIGGEPWSVWIANKKISSNISEVLYNYIHDEHNSTYWKTKADVTDTTLRCVDWGAIHGAMAETRRSRQVFISKHVSGMCGVGKFMKRWKQRDHDSCPRCGVPEDAPHVWVCRGESSDEVWQKSISHLDHWLLSVDTNPDLREAVCLYLNSWRNGEALQTPVYDLLQLIQAQSTIGWQRFIEGWLATDWAVLQQRYYDLIRSRRTGRRWVIELIKKMWNIAWDLWEHRNSVLHNQENIVSRRQLRQLDTDIRRIYLDLEGRSLPANDIHLLTLPLTRLLQKEVTFKQAWLANAIPAQALARNRRWQRSTRLERELREMRDGLRRWLHGTG